MADEIRVVANQRFDLIDMTRLKQAIQEAVGHMLGKILGNPENYTGAARDTNFRPLLLCNFDFNIVLPMSIQVDQYYTAAGTDYEALIYDSNGYRLTGPNAVTPKVFVSAMVGAGTWYLMARRLPVDTSLESRKHYSAALGEYSANINTRTYDDWELHEDTVPAFGNVALRNAGWVDIAEFTTNAVPNITGVTPVDGYPMQDLDWLTWAITDPDRPVLNVFEWLAGVSQIIRRMRYGDGVVMPIGRHWYTDPRFDACLENRGGIRFGDGATGLVDNYIRVLASELTQVLIGNGVAVTGPGDADDLRHLRVKACIAGDLNSGGAPNIDNPVDPVTSAGFIYSNNKDGVNNPIAVVKYNDISLLPCAQSFFVGGAACPFDPGLAVANRDLLWKADLGHRYQGYARDDGGVNVSGAYITGVLDIPNNCRLSNVFLSIDVLVAFAANLRFNCRLAYITKASNIITLLNQYTYSFVSGAPWSIAGSSGSIIAFDRLADAVAQTELIDNQLYKYYVILQLETVGIVAGNWYVESSGGTAEFLIREASGYFGL